MTLSQNPLRNAAMLSIALMVSSILFGASTSHARSNAIVYTAELVAPVEAANHIIKGTVIQCAGTECKGRKSSSAVRSVCAKLADEVGELASFSYKGEAVDQEAVGDV